MKRILIATTMLVAASSAYADNKPCLPVGDEDLNRPVSGTVDKLGLDRASFTDDHAWVDTPVYGADGSELGGVERVRLSADGDVEAVVVEHGGTLDVGGREVLIDTGNYAAATVDGDERLELTYTMTEFEALPDFDEDIASDYPMSDGELGDDARLDDEAGTVGHMMTTDAAMDNTPAAHDETMVAMHGEADRSDGNMHDAGQANAGFTDTHAWVNTPVIGSDGSELGNIERVRLSADGEVDAVVIEHGGTLDVGGREVLIEIGNYGTLTADGQERLEMAYTMAEFEALPDFDENMVSDYPLSDDDVAADDASMDDDSGTVTIGQPVTGDVAMDDTVMDSNPAPEDETMAALHDDDPMYAHEDGTDAMMDETADGVAGYTDTHAWIDTPVFGSDGSELGNLERVRLSADNQVEAVVVEYGGTADIGGREVLIEAGNYRVATVDGEERLELTYTMAEVEALPDFDEDTVSDYPLSDDEIMDDGADEEMDNDPSGF